MEPRSEVGLVGLVALALVASTAGAAEPGMLSMLADGGPSTDDGGEGEPELTHVGRVDASPSRGIAVDGQHVYAAGSGLTVVDGSSPEDPEPVGSEDARGRDVELADVGDRSFAVVAASNDGIRFVDVTDPSAPALSAELSIRSHNVGVFDAEDVVYNAAGSSSTAIEIVDASDPTDPSVATVWDEGIGCHDIAVAEQDRRAYCATGDDRGAAILDVDDPLQPEIVATVTNANASTGHWAAPSPDGETMVLGDEAFGQGCQGDSRTAALLGPLASDDGEEGGLWFYDVTDPSDPRQLSYLEAPSADEGSCTAHFGGFVDGDLLAVGWYDAGVLLVDLSDRSEPTVVEQWNPRDSSGLVSSGEDEDVWDVRHLDGYLFTGDENRGIDVLRIDR